MGFLGQKLAGALGGIPWLGAYLILLVAYVLLHYLFVSQTAHLLALFGVFLDVGVKLGVPVAPLAFALLFATNYFSVLTPQGSSANLLFAGSGYLTQGELYRLGAITTVFSFLVYAVAGTPWVLLVDALRAHRSEMTWFLDALRQNPELAIFLTLAIGFLIGTAEDRLLHPRERRRDAHRRRRRRADRRRRPPARQDRLLRPLPLRHRLQGRTAVLPGAEEERPLAGVADGRPLRHEPPDDGRRGEDLQVRRRDGRRPHGGRLHRVDGHRDGGRRDRPAGHLRGREDAPEEQHPGRLCRLLPRRDRLRRLVPLEPRAAPPEGEPEGGSPEARGADGRRRSPGRRTTPPATAPWVIRAYRLPDGAPSVADRRGAREGGAGAADLREADPARGRGARPRTRHGPRRRRRDRHRGPPKGPLRAEPPASRTRSRTGTSWTSPSRRATSS